MSVQQDASKPRRRQVPISEGLFILPSSPEQTGHLIGNKCHSCGEVFFPKKLRCLVCAGGDMQEVALSTRGKVYSFTVIRAQPPDPYKGPEPFQPYGVGNVELPEGVRILSVLTGCNVDDLRIGMDLVLTFEKQYEDDQGNEVMTYKFKPVRGQ